MKQFLLIACFIMGSFAAAHAGNGLTKSANDSAINAGKSVLSAKITQLQSAYTANPASASSAQLTNDVLQLLRKGLIQTKNAVGLELNKTLQSGINSRFLALETAQYNFNRLASNPALNHVELVRQAQAFASKY